MTGSKPKLLKAAFVALGISSCIGVGAGVTGQVLSIQMRNGFDTTLKMRDTFYNALTAYNNNPTPENSKALRKSVDAMIGQDVSTYGAIDRVDNMTDNVAKISFMGVQLSAVGLLLMRRRRLAQNTPTRKL